MPEMRRHPWQTRGDFMTKVRQDFTTGPLFIKLIAFALPIMATNLLQIFYNAADKMVVGQFSGDEYALGAIGCTTFIYSLIINFMVGIGSGSGIVVAQFYGAGRREDTSRAVHTSMLLAVLVAVIFSGIAYATEVPLLKLLGTHEVFMAPACLYLNIVFVGIFATAVYNFGAAILRATGDSKTPLIISMVSGLINVLLNIFFVTVCDMSVEGVAIATVISQYFSAGAVVVVLYRRKGESYQLIPSRLTMDKKLLSRIIRLGIPTGLQSSCFSITNMATSWAVNTFPSEYVTAFSVAGNIDGMIDACSGAFLHSAMNATGQNYGAMKTKRVIKVFIYSLIQGMGFTFILSQTVSIFRGELAALFVDKAAENYSLIIECVVEWTGTMLATYFLQGAMNSVFGSVRGMGYSVMPLIMNIIGTCVVRLLWIFVIFPLPTFHTFSGLALLYPASWLASTVLIAAISIFAFVRLNKMVRASGADEADGNTDKIAV